MHAGDPQGCGLHSPQPRQENGKTNIIVCSGWTVSSSRKGSHHMTFSKECAIPPPGSGQLRVKVHAAGVNANDGDWAARATAPGPHTSSSNLVQHDHRCSRATLGMEGAGVVEAVGSDVCTDFCVGDRVMFFSDSTDGTTGTFCQYAVVSAQHTCKLPDVLLFPVLPTNDGCSNETAEGSPIGPVIDYVEAATFPIAAEAAYLALFDKLKVERGSTIVVFGASGGVGSVAVQLAHYFGLTVIAVCSTPHMQYVEELGADYAVDYSREQVQARIMSITGTYGADYVLQAGPTGLLALHASVARVGGAVCSLSSGSDHLDAMFFHRQLSAHFVSVLSLRRCPLVEGEWKVVDHMTMTLFMEKAFRVEVEEVPLDRAAVAVDVVRKHHTRGKLVLTYFHPHDALEERIHRRRRMLLLGSAM